MYYTVIQYFSIQSYYTLSKAIIKCWLHSLCCTLHSCIFFILYFSSLYLLILYVYLAPLPPALPLLVTNLFTLSLFLLHFVSIFRFYIVFVFLCLTYRSKIHPCCKWEDFTFWLSVCVHIYIYTHHILFIHLSARRLLPYPGYCK